jgi:hypothetical protein
VGCFECHSLNPESHTDNFEHYGYDINVIVSPNDCSTCHSLEAEQFSGSKKANAWGNLKKNPVYTALVETVTNLHGYDDGRIASLGSSEHTQNETCYACHGSKVEVTGFQTVEFEGDELEVPDLTNWPNQGVGRINPDGSQGACTACHPRHTFSIETARKPYTCSQCHLQPDLPAWDVFKESKHGNILESNEDDYTWDTVPWRVGTDFRSPTCATCHNALIATPDGDPIVERSHDFGSRLWWRIFGLIYSHPQPKAGATHTIKNKDGLPLPAAFTGELASDFLIDAAEQAERRATMGQVCNACHSSDWTNGHFAQMDSTHALSDEMVLTSTQLMSEIWEKGLADNSNPFDEPIEHMWIKQWLFYANSIRYGVAMAGPDYVAFKHGWWDMNETLADMKEWLELHSSKK